MKRFLVLILIIFCFCFSFSVCAVSAKSFVVLNGDTGEVLCSDNMNSRLPMASTTKIMTALVLLERGNLEQKVKITEQMVRVEGTSMGLSVGDEVTLRDLLYGLMLCSGNDSANAIAITVGGSIKGFVKLMNEKATELSLENTSFETPSGLDGENHFTSAYDLAVITKNAFKFKEFREVVASKSKTLVYGNPPIKRTITNHNKLLKMYDDVIGVKTGFTKKSGRCLVSASGKDGKFVIVVTLNDGDDWLDHRKLLDMGLSLISKKNIPKSVESIDIIGSCDKTVKAIAEKETVFLKDNSEITSYAYMPKFLYAPIKKSETVGYEEYYFEGKKILKREKKALKSVDVTKPNVFKIIIQNLFLIIRSLNEGQ